MLIKACTMVFVSPLYLPQIGSCETLILIKLDSLSKTHSLNSDYDRGLKFETPFCPWVLRDVNVPCHAPNPGVVAEMSFYKTCDFV